MSDHTPLSDLLALQGASPSPLSILLYLCLAARPIGQREMVRTLGGSWNKVHACLTRLEGLGLARPASLGGGGWVPTEQAGNKLFQLVSAFGQAPLNQRRSASDSEAPINGSGSGSLNTDLSLLDSDPQPPPNGRTASDSEAAPPPPAVLRPEVLQALAAAGIYGRVRRELAALPYVTAEYVRAHAVKARQDGMTTGVLVYRIRDGWDFPPGIRPRNSVEAHLLEGWEPIEERETALEAEAFEDYPASESEAPTEAEALPASQPEAPLPMPTPVQVDAWLRAQDELHLTMTGMHYDMVVKRLRLVGYEAEAHCFTLETSHSISLNWLRSHALSNIEHMLTRMSGRPAQVVFVARSGAKA